MKGPLVKTSGKRVELKIGPKHEERHLKINGEDFRCRKVIVEAEVGEPVLVTVSFYPGDVDLEVIGADITEDKD